jgi:uncharacterized membrane protein YfcA
MNIKKASILLIAVIVGLFVLKFLMSFLIPLLIIAVLFAFCIYVGWYVYTKICKEEEVKKTVKEMKQVLKDFVDFIKK